MLIKYKYQISNLFSTYIVNDKLSVFSDLRFNSIVIKYLELSNLHSEVLLLFPRFHTEN